MARPKRRKDSTPLDAKMQALQLRHEKLLRQMEEHKQLIADAPRRAKQQESERRKELMTRDARVFTRLNSATLADPRSDFQPRLKSKPLRRKTRRERREARIKFLVLLVFVGVLVAFLIKVLM